MMLHSVLALVALFAIQALGQDLEEGIGYSNGPVFTRDLEDDWWNRIQEIRASANLPPLVKIKSVQTAARALAKVRAQSENGWFRFPYGDFAPSIAEMKSEFQDPSAILGYQDSKCNFVLSSTGTIDANNFPMQYWADNGWAAILQNSNIANEVKLADTKYAWMGAIWDYKLPVRTQTETGYSTRSGSANLMVLCISVQASALESGSGKKPNKPKKIKVKSVDDTTAVITAKHNGDSLKVTYSSKYGSSVRSFVGNKITLEGLTPKTKYVLKISSENGFGSSGNEKIKINTEKGKKNQKSIEARIAGKVYARISEYRRTDTSQSNNNGLPVPQNKVINKACDNFAKMQAADGTTLFGSVFTDLFGPMQTALDEKYGRVDTNGASAILNDQSQTVTKGYAWEAEMADKLFEGCRNNENYRLTMLGEWGYTGTGVRCASGTTKVGQTATCFLNAMFIPPTVTRLD